MGPKLNPHVKGSRSSARLNKEDTQDPLQLTPVSEIDDHGKKGETNRQQDPSTAGSTSENKVVKKDVLKKKVALEECFSSSHEPSTPDSGYFAVSSSSESPKDERVEKQRVSVGGALNAKPEIAVAHPILESSPGTIFKLPPAIRNPSCRSFCFSFWPSPGDEERSVDATKN